MADVIIHSSPRWGDLLQRTGDVVLRARVLHCVACRQSGALVAATIRQAGGGPDTIFMAVSGFMLSRGVGARPWTAAIALIAAIAVARYTAAVY